MQDFTHKIGKYTVEYTNKEEFKILKDEIFNKHIYDIKLDTPTPSIFDLGAHIGLSAIYFKTKFPDSHIEAFEPNPNIYPILENNILCNGLTNINLHNVALGNADSIREFYIDKSHLDCFSTGSFYKDAWNGEQSTLPITVRVEKLSKYITKSIDLLKMDIEGAELEVIKDLQDNDKLKYIKNIIIEYHPIKGRNVKNLLTILKENHFETTMNKDPLGTPLINILGKNNIQ